MKWVAGFPGNRALGLPAIHGLVLLNDPRTGVPAAILDAGPITAERTAAVSGVAIARFAPRVAGRAPRAGLIGAGVQGRSHLPVLGRVLPGVDLIVFDRHPDRAAALADAGPGDRRDRRRRGPPRAPARRSGTPTSSSRRPRSPAE